MGAARAIRARTRAIRSIRSVKRGGLGAVLAVLGGLALVVTVAGPARATMAAVGRLSRQAAASDPTVWLCHPGQANDPCVGDLTTTAVTSSGATSTIANTTDPSSKFDCFYVYPTTSTQQTANANLEVQPAEIAAAREQAAQFSQVCNVWAPMYRQRTALDLSKGLGGDPAADQVAYASLLSGWKDYLANDNHGRPIVFIGHSQGAAMLTRLLRQQVDPNPTLRHRMVSAIILGGNVQVPTGKTAGGSFKNIPICTSVTQVGCVIAYSSFRSPPAPNSNFGRPGQGVSLQSGQTKSAGQQVACVNPGNLSRGTAALNPYFLSVMSKVPGVPISTPWVTYPALYTAQCASRGGATWLQIRVIQSVGDSRPIVQSTLGPDWGLHLVDVNLALGNLVRDLRVQESAFH